ncbi:fusaric acid resistance protein [Oecophyllibacter saccharovorans]|uniref:Fusaric acid resistance protein n=1 Tax=Oecophyllibacter saccharovorans TaxID=2558360 RepID=A0A506URP5_9PROT|nr:FUSC family protein [Oecophyllibacter saccharovorans]QDH14880.1 fusaric acid resistance protein [Oecophyllibacter saccharovorans]TPW36020.1 fusaric acid resistance protein [Oecophyllibacter saccharovorans]
MAPTTPMAGTATPAGPTPPQTARLKERDESPVLLQPGSREYTYLPWKRLWALLWAPAPGRMGHTIRLTVTSIVAIMIGEIWHIPASELTPIIILALWAPDRVTNVIIGTSVFCLFSVMLVLVYVAVLLSINNYFLTLFVNLVFTFIFFYLGSATKLGLLSIMSGLSFCFFLLMLDQVPISDLISRALLYSWLETAITGATMVAMALLIAPSPLQLTLGQISARLKTCAGLLRAPEDPTLQEKARDFLLVGVTPMLTGLGMAKLEKLWRPIVLNRARQGVLNSFALLALTTRFAREESFHDAPLDERLRCAGIFETLADLLDRNALPDPVPEAGFHSPDLQKLNALLQVLCAPSSETLPSPPKSRFFLPGAFETPNHIRFAIKGTLSVLLSILIYKGLNWNGIHTCVITCFVVALPTMGEIIAKQRLRIIGAVIGCTLAGLATAFLIPHFINVAQLILMLGLGILAGGWIKCGNERIAYAGLQIVLASYLSDLTAFKPPTDLSVPLDRVIGILIGLAITYVAFTRFWPQSAGQKLPGLFRKLQTQLHAATLAPTPLLRYAATAKVTETISSTERTLEYNMLEPVPYCPTPSQLRTYRTLLLQAGELAGDILIAPDYPAELGAAAALFERLTDGLAP